MTKAQQLEITLYGYLQKHGTMSPSSAYLITEDRVITYGEALVAAENLGAKFLELGMKKGALVAIRATRSPDVAILVCALSSIGAVVVATDAHFTVRDYIANTGVEICPDWYITNESLGLAVDSTGSWSFQNREKEVWQIAFDFEKKENEGYRYATKQVQPDDPFMIIFTSGSTGKSKAVMLSHKNCIANPVDAMPLFQQNEKDRAISLLPLNHVFGFAVISCATFCGHDIVFPKTTKAEYVLSCIEKYKISVLYSVPTFILELLADSKHKDYDVSSLRLGLMAGGPFTEKQMRFIEGELGLQLMPGYGMSECVGISTMSYGDPVEDRAAGVGRLYPMTEAYILDDNGEEAAVGETGEICVKGATQMLGYYNNEEATKEAVDEQGRLHTGDLGYFDEKGILHINGRKKDLIIRGGENISAGKVETALLTTKGIYQAAVVPVKDEKYGEVVGAMIMLEKGVNYTEEDTRCLLKDKLSKHEIPEIIHFVTEFPKTSSGKIDKIKVKEMIQSYGK
ncbi:MAG: acyl--CoA ligase [Clostridia bacterium]|nr:acyl--CoA ligase [Clostridia bacterium]